MYRLYPTPNFSFSESTLLKDSNKDDTMEKAIFAITIVHELAHQWFGNLVTSSWFDFLFYFINYKY
jgi:aminopeptidase N